MHRRWFCVSSGLRAYRQPPTLVPSGLRTLFYYLVPPTSRQQVRESTARPHQPQQNTTIRCVVKYLSCKKHLSDEDVGFVKGKIVGPHRSRASEARRSRALPPAIHLEHTLNNSQSKDQLPSRVPRSRRIICYQHAAAFC